MRGGVVMSDEVVGSSGSEGAGFSRRNALKAGVAAGVGVAAWSGATITSLGGTPAYAVGCTFVVKLDLSDGCRNTDNASGCTSPPSGFIRFRYHTLKTTGLPSGYTITHNIGEGVCCTDTLANRTATLTFPAGITCVARVGFFDPPQCSPPEIQHVDLGSSSTGTLNMVFNCPPDDVGSNDQYTVVATCSTTGAPEECFD
jgi:hypothetical protein